MFNTDFQRSRSISGTTLYWQEHCEVHLEELHLSQVFPVIAKCCSKIGCCRGEDQDHAKTTINNALKHQDEYLTQQMKEHQIEAESLKDDERRNTLNRVDEEENDNSKIDPYLFMGFGFVAMKKTWLTVTAYFAIAVLVLTCGAALYYYNG